MGWDGNYCTKPATRKEQAELLLEYFDTLEDFLREKGERFNLSADARMDEAMSPVNDS